MLLDHRYLRETRDEACMVREKHPDPKIVRHANNLVHMIDEVHRLRRVVGRVLVISRTLPEEHREFVLKVLLEESLSPEYLA